MGKHTNTKYDNILDIYFTYIDALFTYMSADQKKASDPMDPVVLKVWAALWVPEI